MEIPILMGVEGEAQEIIGSYQAGLCFEPENEADFCDKLDRVLSDEQLYEQCKKGCYALSEDFDRQVLAQHMWDVFNKHVQA